MGSFSGEHKKYGTMTCVDYAAGWRKETEEDPMKTAIDAIRPVKIEFETPENSRGWDESSNIKSDGKTVSKTTTKTFIMRDGSKKVETKTITKIIEY